MSDLEIVRGDSAFRRVLGDGQPYDLPLADHPEILIAGWEDMDLALRAA